MIRIHLYCLTIDMLMEHLAAIDNRQELFFYLGIYFQTLSKRLWAKCHWLSFLQALASTDSITSFLKSKYFSTEVLLTSDFNLSKLFCCFESQCQATSPSRSFRSGALMSDMFGTNLARYWSRPKNLISAALSAGSGMFCIALTFSLSGFNPSVVRMCPT